MSGITINMINCEDIRNFCLAGNAHLILKSLDTRNGLRYRIQKVEEPTGVDSLYFVGYWYTNQYIYIGVIRNNDFQHTRKSAVPPSDVVFQLFHDFWKLLIEKNRLDPSLEFCHESKCGRCGKPMANVTFRHLMRGIGPECEDYVNQLYVEHRPKKNPGKQLRLFGGN